VRPCVEGKALPRSGAVFDVARWSAVPALQGREGRRRSPTEAPALAGANLLLEHFRTRY